jgi:hypothetical protein
MKPVTREKGDRDLRVTGAYRAEIKVRIEALDGYAASPWYKKGFTRA